MTHAVLLGRLELRGRPSELRQKEIRVVAEASGAARLGDHFAVVLAGGCAYNSVANGKIFDRSPFKHVYVQSAGGDAGGSIGAAFETWRAVEGDKARRHFVMSHSYWGPHATAQEIAAICPAAMVFIPGEYDGISHNPREYSTPQACTQGVQVLASVVRRLAG